MRPRVVTRIHAEGLGLLHVMDQNLDTHSDDEGTLDSVVVYGAGRRTPLFQALTSSGLRFHVPFLVQPVLGSTSNYRSAFFRLSWSMVSASLYAVGRIAGWYYIPDVVTRQLIKFSHRYIPNPPKPGTPAFSRHYRIAYATVVLGFLAYNLMEAYRAMPLSFYDILDVHLDFTEEELTKANRAFARKNHPDRGGTEDVFIQGRSAYNILKDPITRFAYDRYDYRQEGAFNTSLIRCRFGPEIASWTNCKTQREFLRQGLIQSAGYHIVTGVGLFIWSTVSPSTVNFVCGLLESRLLPHLTYSCSGDTCFS